MDNVKSMDSVVNCVTTTSNDLSDTSGVLHCNDDRILREANPRSADREAIGLTTLTILNH